MGYSLCLIPVDEKDIAGLTNSPSSILPAAKAQGGLCFS